MRINPAPPQEWQPLWDSLRKSWRWAEIDWYETTEAIYFHMLGAVPPAAQRGNAFLCGEAAYHDDGFGEPVYHDDGFGEPVYHAFCIYEGRYLARDMTLELFRGLFPIK